jgi:hypothetical protein
MPSTLNVVTQPLLKSGTPGTPTGSPSNVPSAVNVRNWKMPGADALSRDLESLSNRINSINTTLSTVSPTVSQILITDSKTGAVIAAVGNLTFQGVTYTNWFREIHAGDFLLTNDPTKAVFNVNTDGSVSIGDNGWIDIHDPFGGNAAWIGTQYDTLPITGAADNGAGLIRLLVPGHTLATGNSGVQVLGMQNAGVPNATGVWTVTKIDASHVDLQGSVFAGLFAAPSPDAGIQSQVPSIDRVLQVTGAVANGGLIRLKFAAATGYESGTEVNVAGVGGVPNATGQWVISVPPLLAVTGAADNGAGLIRLTVPGHNFTTGDKPQALNVGGVPNANGYYVLTVIDASHVDQQGSTFAGAYTSGGTISFLNANVLDLATNAQTGAASVFAGGYTSGGTCLQYYAGMLAQTVAIGLSFGGYKLRAFPSGDLRIRNASIQLTSSVGQITLDPTTTQIMLTNFSNLSSITLDATVPALTFRDQIGDPSVTIEILQETPKAIASATNASPIVMHVVGSSTAPSWVNGDTIFVQGATGNTIINGYRIIENYNTAAETFTLTDLQGHAINGTGAFAGAATAARYYAGLLAQTMALGSSFPAYRLRFFADGSLKINNASISASTVTNSTVTASSFTSIGGTAPDTVTLSISNGLLSIVGAGTAVGTGTITIDGLMTAGGYAVGATLGADGPVVISGLTLNFSKGIFTSQSGAFSFTTSGFSGNAVVRNSAGTGSSTFVIANGLVTSYTP